MAKAIWNGRTLAECDMTIKLKGNVFFPPDSINREYTGLNSKHTTCPWKGVASYYDVTVEGETNPRAARTYPDPSQAAREIEDYVAFWRGVRVEG